MTESLRLINDFCFERVKLNRIHAACLVHNTRSHNTLLRAGFVKEGFAARYIEINGQYQDHILFGLTRACWDQAPKNA
jgi:ribosomal-protein-alanine N-acetyltransferase